MTSFNFSRRLAALALLASPILARAQTSDLVTAQQPAKIAAKRGESVEVRLALQVRNGYHTNSNAPNDDYLIPLRLKWEPGPLEATDIVYPKPELKDYKFSQKPVSVFTGEFQVTTKFKVNANAPAGLGTAIGKVRYQACSENTCYRPQTVEIKLPYEIH